MSNTEATLAAHGIEYTDAATLRQQRDELAAELGESVLKRRDLERKVKRLEDDLAAQRETIFRLNHRARIACPGWLVQKGEAR